MISYTYPEKIDKQKYYADFTVYEHHTVWRLFERNIINNIEVHPYQLFNGIVDETISINNKKYIGDIVDGLNRLYTPTDFQIGDTLIFDPNSFDQEYWNKLSDEDKRKYYGDLYNFDNPDDPYFFTFIAEHAPQNGHCILINMQNQKIETMRHISDFRLVNDDEC